MAWNIENDVPGVLYNGLNTNKAVNFASGASATAGGVIVVQLGSAATLPGWYWGSGAPTVTAGKGSFYLRTDGSGTTNRMYVNTDGGTTWTNVTTAA